MMSKMTFIKLSGLIFLLANCIFASNPIYAEINTELHKFFDSLGEGFDANVTPAGAYSGQAAGYYTGGSLYARTKVSDVNLVQIDLPSYRSGCGGIDLFLGGMSFIKKDELVKMAKNIMNNAAGYAFTLALETATPVLANTMKYLQEQAAKLNAMNINSCETAAALVGSVWPKTQEAQRRVCADIGNGGLFSDYAEAKQECGNAGGASSTLSKAQGAKKNTVLSEGNLAWIAINKNSFLSSDHALAELFMSLSGTIIVREKQGQSGPVDEREYEFDAPESLVPEGRLLSALLNGGQARIYKCDEYDKCLRPSAQDITISQDNSLKKRVSLTLRTLAEKFVADNPIVNKEKGLMQATALPIQKMLNVQIAFYKERSVLDISSYSDVIAIDILFQYLNDCMNTVRASAAILQYPRDIMNDFYKSVESARKALHSQQMTVYAEITTKTSIIRQTKMIEDLLSSSISENMSANLKWAKGEV